MLDTWIAVTMTGLTVLILLGLWLIVSGLAIAAGKADLSFLVDLFAVLLRLLSWAVYLTPGVPPGERVLFSLQESLTER